MRKLPIERVVKLYAGKVASYSDESACGDGYWLYLKPGWSRWGEVHSVHEWTIKDLIAAILEVERCECLECKHDLEKF